MVGQSLMLGPGIGGLLTCMITQEDQEMLDILSPYRSFKGEEALTSTTTALRNRNAGRLLFVLPLQAI